MKTLLSGEARKELTTSGISIVPGSKVTADMSWDGKPDDRRVSACLKDWKAGGLWGKALQQKGE